MADGNSPIVAAPAESGLALLRRPFPSHQVSKLPKPTKVQTDEVKNDFKKGVRCAICGSWHHPAVVHLDYVGHAALTDRLLDADPAWFWEPAALRDGLPAFDQAGGLWIKLTVCGVSRLGYGHAAAKSGQDPGAREKEVIGDALRNAAMRFGAALDLWHKGDLHLDDEADSATLPAPAVQTEAVRSTSVHQARKDGGDDKWRAVQADFHSAERVSDLQSAAARHAETIQGFPAGWQREARSLYRERIAELEEAESALDGAAKRTAQRATA